MPKVNMAMMIAIFVAVLLGGIFVSRAITNLSSASEHSTPVVETFVVPTVLPTLTVIPVTPLRLTPVYANSQSIKVNATPIAETTDYTFNDDTGVATINTDVIASGDTVQVTYSFVTPAQMSALYVALGVVVIAVIVIAFVKRGGLKGKSS